MDARSKSVILWIVAMRVCVLATGARTPVGLTVESTAAAVRAGISRIKMHPELIDYTGEPIRAGTDPRIVPDVFGWTRLLSIARSPLEEACSALGQASAGLPPSIVVQLGLPEQRPGWTQADQHELLDALRGEAETLCPGCSLTFRVAGLGHASTLYALHAEYQKISRGEVELSIVGGVDSYLEEDTLFWLQKNRQLNCAGVRGGFLPGEGAAFVILASENYQRWLGVEPLAEVVGAGHSFETNIIKSDGDVLGRGLAEAVREASSSLRLPDEAIDALYGDINGERYRSEEWGMVALRTAQLFRDPSAFQSPAESFGDIGAASGAMLVALAIESWRRGYARGPRALVWTASEAGLRAATVLKRASA